MRWGLLVLASCQFSPNGGQNIDPRIDARMRDAALDGDGVPIDMPADARPDAPVTVVCGPLYAMKYNGHSYRKTALKTTRDVARADCGADGGHLIKIETSGEDAFSFSQFTIGTSTFFWIGLTFSNTSGWHWDDGTPLAGYQNWFNGTTPINPPDPCVDASPDFTDWSAFSCTSSVHQGLCECDGP